MHQLINLVNDFREKMDCAFHAGLFSNDFAFNHFPRGCCGDTCELLAKYLKENRIPTIYVCGTWGDQTHAWLVVKDCNVHIPISKHNIIPNNIKGIIQQYGANNFDVQDDVLHYEESDLIDGTIIDITADQFGQPPIYIGPIDSFHKQFIFDFAYDCENLGQTRLFNLYNLIMHS